MPPIMLQTKRMREALMSDNVIKFRKPAPPPKQPRPGLRKLVIGLCVVAAFGLVWAYFAFVAPGGL
ncbi:hypothetical protein BJF91_03020 [Allorhizobium taibaishanense]|uniref:Uncharacterized protein n=2 Tax=Allorhizobium taibaishanense TaxID=887144 RepID=A0A1Q8ZYJ1_9HYPH|nr:hypothetical protein BJF91_03020 [Allorhizobium taibaishanense]